jgi:hypothetical protein
MPRHTRFVVLAVAGCTLGSGLWAQTEQGRAQEPPGIENPHTPSDGDLGRDPATPKPAPDDPSKAPGSEPFQENLQRNDGVIEPPRGVDPEMRRPPPENFKDTMPVIPPPGEPGDKQGVPPK